MRDVLQKIIVAGTKAPSGENCQPWKFEVKGSEVSVFNLTERDQSLYSWGQRASFLAHGALLENMIIAGSELGYNAAISLFPEPEKENLVTRVIFQKSTPRKEPLYPAIEKRTTNRKPYKKIPLGHQEKNKLLGVNGYLSGAKILLTDDLEKVKILAKYASKNEKILFENKHLHNFFFSHINWNLTEDKTNSIGFYIDTLELPPPARLGFKLFKNWTALNIFNKVGLSNLVSLVNSKVHSSASAIGVVTIPNIEPKDFVLAGRMMERLWLTATSLGFSLQPLTGILFLRLRIINGDKTNFSSRHIELIESVYEKVKNIFNVGDDHIVMLFRLGKSGEPSARSSRLPPDIKWN